MILEAHKKARLGALMKVALLTTFIVFLLNFGLVESTSTKTLETCKKISSCEPCTDLKLESCSKTGYHVKLRCVKNGANMTNVDGDVVGTPKELLDGIRFSEKYSSCGEVANGTSSWQFFLFQSICLILFVIAGKHVYAKREHHYKKLAQSRRGSVLNV